MLRFDSPSLSRPFRGDSLVSDRLRGDKLVSDRASDSSRLTWFCYSEHDKS